MSVEDEYANHNRQIKMGPKGGNWRVIVAMLLSGLVAVVSGAYLLTA